MKLKVLMIFIDMLRAINQNVCNADAPHNKLDDALEKFGGIVYSNCYSPAPDTPRGLGSIWTGTYPKVNGCNARVKYPRYFLNEDLDNLWKLFKREHLSLNIFAKKWRFENGFMPEGGGQEEATLFDDGDLNRFVNSVEIADNSVTFVCIDDYHFIIDDYHSKLNGLERLYDVVGSEVDLIFNKLGRDTFDVVVIFSDHGCLLEGDGVDLPHRGRVQTYLQIWAKGRGIDKISRDNRLCSCMDIFPTMAYLLNGFVLNRIDGLNIFSNIQHSFLVIEDYFDFSATRSQVLGWYGIILPGQFIQTDCSDNWFVECNPVHMPEEWKNIFRTILTNYATDYAENIRLQKIVDSRIKDAEMGKKSTGPRFYANGEVRIAQPE